MSLASAYLDSFNSEQRSAVEHGIGVAGHSGPLLGIAGAGSGKTNTLAHQLAGFSGRPCLYAGLSTLRCTSISSISACSRLLARFLAPSFPINTWYRLIFNLRAARVSPIPSLYARILRLS